MSLEAKIEALTNAVIALTEAQTEHTERLNAVLAGGAKADDGEKPARKPRAKKTETAADTDADTGEGDDDAGTTTALTNEGVKKVVAAWLTEFAKDQNDGETQARKEKIKGTLTAMQKKDGFKIADAEKGVTIMDVPASELHRIITWLDKQKAADNGFGTGRLTEAPGSAKSEADDSDDI